MTEYTDDQLLNEPVTPIAYEDSEPVYPSRRARVEREIVASIVYRDETVNVLADGQHEWRGQLVDTLADMQAHIDHEIANL
jgi:hypothetical protein